MLLTSDQIYIKYMFEKVRWMTEEQCGRLLKKRNHSSGADVNRMLHQMRHLGIIVHNTDADVYCLAEQRKKPIDKDMLLTVDIMLDVSGPAQIAAISTDSEPFKLSFLLDDGKDLKSCAIAAVRSGEEEKYCLLMDNQDKRTLFLLLDKTTQMKNFCIAGPHFFVMKDRGAIRYFKGNIET